MSSDHGSWPSPARSWMIAVSLAIAMAAFVTWPTAITLADGFFPHVDSYFSTWRLMWIAHALQTDPDHLFDANIFHPSTGTLAYSDATLLQGALTAPFLWAGASPIVMYNVMLLVGFAGSGVAMFVLARHLTGRMLPALVASAVFSMAPYRLEHAMHLEMQWAMWIPLSLWSLTRTIEERSWRFGALSGVLIWFQVLSCVYYGVFLALVLLVFVPLLLIRERTGAIRAFGPVLLAAVIATALTLPYARPYIENARALGDRPASDIMALSATWPDYLASSPLSRWWGWTSDRLGDNERHLFPGLVSLLLAAAAFAGGFRRHVWLYAALALTSVEISLGLNGWLYSALFDYVPGIRGLRSPARIAIIAQCAIAALAALGVSELSSRFGTRRSWRTGAVGSIALLLVVFESASWAWPVQAVRPPDPAAYDVYRAINSQGPGVVLELPVPRLDALPGHEAVYAFQSAAHWNKLVNGYSGYYPHVYAETLNVMQHFPNDESIARLQRLDVRYIVVNRDLLPSDR
ncbi:MAG: hypothetical protein AB7N65_29275, partial [Vicinamibacterales bacterium]